MKTIKRYIFMYKCRGCNKDDVEGPIFYKMNNTLLYQADKNPITHDCTSDFIGIADFIGYKIED